MGQGYCICNISKRQFIHPHRFGDGYKLLEFGPSGDGTMAGLALLLADGNGRGGGDAEEHPIIGTWAGDRIVIAGDYADEGRWLDELALTEQDKIALSLDAERPFDSALTTLHSVADVLFRDVSAEVIEALERSDIEVNQQ